MYTKYVCSIMCMHVHVHVCISYCLTCWWGCSPYLILSLAAWSHNTQTYEFITFTVSQSIKFSLSPFVFSSGLSRSYLKTTIGDDGFPNPGGVPSQQAPMTIAGSQVPRAHIIRALEPKVPQVGGVHVLPPHHSVKVGGTIECLEEREERREKGREWCICCVYIMV